MFRCVGHALRTNTLDFGGDLDQDLDLKFLHIQKFFLLSSVADKCLS